jgi:hypothetical protein
MFKSVLTYCRVTCTCTFAILMAPPAWGEVKAIHISYGNIYEIRYHILKVIIGQVIKFRKYRCPVSKKV